MKTPSPPSTIIPAALTIKILRVPLARLARSTLAILSAHTLVGPLPRAPIAAYAFYAAHFPTLGSIFSEPAILAAHRDNLRKVGAGPHRANERVVDYFRAEQRLGRVAADADLELAAAMLLGACFQTAFLASFEGSNPASATPANSANGTPAGPPSGTPANSANATPANSANGTPAGPPSGTVADSATAGGPGAVHTWTRLDPAALGGTIERLLTLGGAP